MILILDKIIRGGVSSVLGNRFIKLDGKIEVLYKDSYNLYGSAMIQILPDEQNTFDKYVNLEEISNTEDFSDIGYVLEVGLQYPDEIKEKPKHFLLCPQNNVSPQDEFSDEMKKKQNRILVQHVKTKFDWTDKKVFA